MISNVLLNLLTFILKPKHPALQQPDDLSWNNIIIPNADVFNIYSGMIGNQLDDVIDSMTYMWALMVVAPTGSGKTTLVRKIIKKVRQAHGKLLYISNRRANSVEFKIKLAQILEDFDIIAKLNKFKKYGDLDLINSISVIGLVTVVTYQSAVKQFGINFTNDGDLKFDWIVMDEINFFSSDSTFNAASLDCLNLVVPKFANACRIYLSATPETVLPSIAETEKEILAFNLGNFNKKDFLAEHDISANQILHWINNNFAIIPNYLFFATETEKWNWLMTFCNQYNDDTFSRYLAKEYPELAKSWPTNFYTPGSDIIQLTPNPDGYERKVIPSDYRQDGDKHHGLQIAVFEKKESHYNLFFFENTGKLEETIATIINSRPDGIKAVVFVNAVSTAEAARKLQKQGTAEVLSRTLVDHEGSKASKQYMTILFSEKFDVDVLYTTKLLDTGTNINDNAVKLVVIALTDPIDVIQSIGRVRTHAYATGEKLNVVFIIPNIAETKEAIRNLRRALYDIKGYVKTAFPAGESLSMELPANTVLYGNRADDISEEEAFILEDISIYGVASEYLPQLQEKMEQAAEVDVHYNYLANQSFLNALHMYSKITGLSLTGDSMDFDPALPIDKTNYVDSWKTYVLGYLSPASVGTADELLSEWGTSFKDIEARKALEKADATEQFITELNARMDAYYNALLATSDSFYDNKKRLRLHPYRQLC